MLKALFDIYNRVYVKLFGLRKGQMIRVDNKFPRPNANRYYYIALIAFPEFSAYVAFTENNLERILHIASQNPDDLPKCKRVGIARIIDNKHDKHPAARKQYIACKVIMPDGGKKFIACTDTILNAAINRAANNIEDIPKGILRNRVLLGKVTKIRLA